MKRVALVVASAALAGCSSTVEITRTVTPRDAMALAPTKLVPVAIAHEGEERPLPAGAIVGPASVRVTDGGRGADAVDVSEVDERGATVAVRSSNGAWTEVGEGGARGSEGVVALARGDRIVMRGRLEIGDELPGGARVIQRRGTSFLVFGALSMVIGWVPAAIAAAASKGEAHNPDIDRPAFVPFVGPWIAMAQRLASPCVPEPIISGANCTGPSLALFGYTVSGITQGLGAIFFIAGLPSHAELWEPPKDDEKSAKVRVVPLALPGGGGVGVGGQF